MQNIEGAVLGTSAEGVSLLESLAGALVLALERVELILEFLGLACLRSDHDRSLVHFLDLLFEEAERLLGNLSEHLKTVELLRVQANGMKRHGPPATVMYEADVVLFALANQRLELLDRVGSVVRKADSLGNVSLEFLHISVVVVVLACVVDHARVVELARLLHVSRISVEPVGNEQIVITLESVAKQLAALGSVELSVLCLRAVEGNGLADSQEQVERFSLNPEILVQETSKSLHGLA